MSNINNVKKRFRQGRVTYKKLKSLIGKHLTESPLQEMKEMKLSNEPGIDMVEENHVHDENCHHFIKYGDTPEHVHDKNCDHEHHQVHPHQHHHPRGE